MGLLDKALVGGAVALAGFVARTLYVDGKDAQRRAEEEKRRKNSPLVFDPRLGYQDFQGLVREVARSTPRLVDVRINGLVVSLDVRSNSGLTTWSAWIDFNDYGHLTGRYWLTTDNTQSPIPKFFADAVRAEIQKRLV